MDDGTAKRQVKAWLGEQEGYGLRIERFLEDAGDRAEAMRPWLEAAWRLGAEAAMEAATEPGAADPVWREYGHVENRTVWTDGEVFRITDGERPTGRGGYGRLESALQLKGLLLRDMTPVDAAAPGR